MPHYLRLTLIGWLLLTATGTVERTIFAVVHSDRLGLTPAATAEAIGVGLRFDAAVAAWFTLLGLSLAVAGHRLLRLHVEPVLATLIAAGVTALVLLQGGDLFYFAEAGRHLGYELKELFNSREAVAQSATTTLALPALAQLTLVAAPLGLLAWHLIGRAAPPTRPRPGRPEAAWLVALPIAVVLARGGLQSVPLEPLHAQTIGDANQAAVVLNGAYNALFSSLTPYSVNRVVSGEPTAGDLAALKSLYAGPPKVAADAAPRPNVVFLFLESWSAQFMASHGYDLVTTPNFDRLRGEGLTTREMLAGGHRTTEGLFSALCSYQNPLGGTVAQSQLQNYAYRCLPRVLADQGYASAFFQGSLADTSGTGAFAQSLGFRASYGKKDLGRTRLEHNSWGAHDPDLYAFALERMRALPQPFLVGINTNSTHDTRLPAGVDPAFDRDGWQGRYANILHFADEALGGFIAALRADPRLAETVVVAFADHAGPSRGAAVHGYRIPFVIHAPGRVPARELPIVASQRDIAPTLLGVLGLAPPPAMTGRSLLAGAGGGADFYHQGLLGWYEGEAGVEFPVDGEELVCRDGGFALRPCPEQAAAMHTRALAFTRLAQSLLFTGRTADFGAVLAAGNLHGK